MGLGPGHARAAETEGAGANPARSDAARLLFLGYGLLAPLALWAGHATLGLDGLLRRNVGDSPAFAAAFVLHIAAGALLLLLIRTLEGRPVRPAPALLGAVFFLAHPIQIETLSGAEGLGVAARGTLVLGALAAFAFRLRRPEARGAYALALLLTAGEAAASPAPPALPLALLLWAAASGQPRARLPRPLPILGIAAAGWAARLAFGEASPAASPGLWERLWYGAALGPWRIASLDGHSTLFVAAATLVGWALYNAEDRRPGIMGLGLLLAASLPASAAMAAAGLHGVAGGAYYLPAAASALLLAWAAEEARLDPPARRRRL